MKRGWGGQNERDERGGMETREMKGGRDVKGIRSFERWGGDEHERDERGGGMCEGNKVR